MTLPGSPSPDAGEDAGSAPAKPRLPDWCLSAACYGLAALAAAIAAGHVWMWATNVPLWDDFDGFLDFLLRVDDAKGTVERFFMAAEFHNEHRTLTTRLATWAATSWTGAPMNFRVLAMLAAATLLPITAMFVLAWRGTDSRRMAALMTAAFLLSLQHHEVLFWGGACEHLTVVLFAMGALLSLRWTAPAGLIGGVLLAGLAGFTLAHGFVVFAAGGMVLALERRWRDAAVLVVSGAALMALWIIGYHGNPAHGGLEASAAQAFEAGRFWLGILGTPFALGQHVVAPWLGALVLTGGVVVVLAAGWREHIHHLGVILFALGSTLLVAMGRVPIDPDRFMVSRYRILSCLLLATVGVLAVKVIRRRRPTFPTEWVFVVLTLAYAAEKTQAHWNRGRDHHERLAVAAAYYAEYRTLADAPVEIYYDLPKANHILAVSRKKRIYDLRAVGKAMEKTAEEPAISRGR